MYCRRRRRRRRQFVDLRTRERRRTNESLRVELKQQNSMHACVCVLAYLLNEITSPHF
jgi:hypothetical protein